MKTLIPILALACLLLVGGCEDGRSLQIKRIESKVDSLGVLALQLSPCPPCPPDTVSIATEYHFITRMPKGRWVTLFDLITREQSDSATLAWNDSVFILKGE